MNTFMKKSSYLFLASTILASTAATSVGVTGGVVAKAEVINEAKQGSTIDFKTTLKDNFVTKNNQIAFDVWATKENGETLLDGDSSNVELLTEQDNTSTSSPIMNMTDYSIKKIHYTLDLKEGQNTITLKIKNGDDVLEKTFHIFKETAQENEVMEDVVFSVEAFNLGIGYIVEPKRISVAYDETYTINSLLEKEDLSLENEGDGETLISATKAKLTEKTTVNVDDELVQALHIEGVREIDLEASGIGDINDGLGVFDFSPVATWKVTKNNSFENFGNSGAYSNIIISEKDVIRTQFTFGGGLELDALDNKNTIDRDEATRALAYINSSEEKATILANKDVKESYDDVMQTIQTFGISQNAIDEKVDALNEAVVEWLTNNTEAQKTYIEDLTDAQLQLWLAPIKEEIDALPPEEALTLENVSTLQKITEQLAMYTLQQQKVIENYAKYEAAMTKISSLIDAKVAEVIQAINALPAPNQLTVEHQADLDHIKTLYEQLPETVRNRVTNYNDYQEAVIKTLSPAFVVKKLIHSLPSYNTLTLDDAQLVQQARTNYEQLTADQRLEVTNYETLEILEGKLQLLQLQLEDEKPKQPAAEDEPVSNDKPAVDTTTDFADLTGSTKTVAQLINTLPALDKITLENGAVLNATYKAFSALSKAEQEKIPNAFTLVIAKAIYDDLQLEEDQKVAKKEIAKIASLPTVSLVDLSDEAAIAEAKAAYAQLDANQKALVTNYATITQLETQIASLKTAALNVQQTISALPSASLITENNRSAIETARAKYTALTTSQKKLVKNVALLDAAEQKLAENQTETVKKLINTINEWPNDITLNEESAIQEARKTYNALPSLQQKAITNYATLLNAETKLAALLNTDRAIAEVVDAMINDLPFTITAKDQAAVEQARKAYRALTASQKLYVTNISVLDKAEATLLAAADNDLKAAKAVVTAIDSLPNEQVVTIEDADNVVAVRDAYRQLTTIQKGYVDNYDTLKAIETALTKVETREKALKAADVEIDIPTVKNTTKTIEGYVTPGAKVAVYIGSKKIATAKVDKDGYYTVNISRQQAGKELKFIVFNEVGDKLLREYIKVKAATVTAASSLKASPTKISGKAPKNKTVTIYKRSKKLKTTKSTANGKFSVKLPKQAKGTTLKVIVSDSVGNKSKSKSVKVK